MCGNLAARVGRAGHFLARRFIGWTGNRTTFFRELRGDECGWGTGETKEIGLLDGDWCGVPFLVSSL